MFANYSKKSSAYYEVRDWLESFIPLVYGKEELGLVRIEELLRLLGNPERKFKSIHIAGTSGKGSTAFYTARLLQGMNLKVGLHISPHLVDVRERMQINGKLIPMGKFIRLISRIKPVVESMKDSEVGLPSYFEILVAASFKYFAQEKVDWAVVEVGLGGRLDATNVLVPEVSVITNIGLDHTEILGNTVEKIAFEKAGIIKAGVPAVTAASGKALGVIENAARDRGSKLVKVSTQKGPMVNQILAETALETIGIGVSEASMKKVFGEGFAGRFEEIEQGVILDGAHNPDKIRALIDFVWKSKVKVQKSKVILVVAFKKGKKWKEMVDLLLKNLNVEQVIATEFNAFTDTGKWSTVPAEEIAKYIKSKSKGPRFLTKSKVESVENSQEAVSEAMNAAKKGEIVLVTGSLYLIGEVRTIWKEPEV